MGWGKVVLGGWWLADMCGEWWVGRDVDLLRSFFGLYVLLMGGGWREGCDKGLREALCSRTRGEKGGMVRRGLQYRDGLSVKRVAPSPPLPPVVTAGCSDGCERGERCVPQRDRPLPSGGEGAGWEEEAASGGGRYQQPFRLLEAGENDP